MAALRAWQQLEPGGAVERAGAERVRTGGWRTGLKPEADLARCVDCLLCWLHCPDSAVVLRGTAFSLMASSDSRIAASRRSVSVCPCGGQAT